MQAAGRLGWSEEQFWLSTPRFLLNAMKGAASREQEAWERARFIAFYAVQPLKAHANNWRINRPADLLIFDWERHRIKAKAEIDPALIEAWGKQADKWWQDELMAKYNLPKIVS
jgi:hypothetical protein